MLPGILAILVTAVGFLLAGLNFVKEKEVGTIEQINVTPIKKYQFITAKMFPFLVIGLIDLALGLVLGRILFLTPFEGSIGLLFLCAAIFLVGILGLALLISTFSSTQQQFMFVAFFFMIVFILMGGIFTPTESMPEWAQKIDMVNPMVYLMRINRMIMLKGSTFMDIRSDIIALSIIALTFSFFAIRRYRKVA
jgi:ABC-2 type transport system permease protein